MRLATGVTDQYLYFVAIDSTDHISRKTGLGSFTVYRSRNGGAATAYTTPTISEVSSANMPGLYKFLIDEDMTIDSGDDTQEVALHITATGMDPVTRVYELFRRPVTSGETLTVASGIGQANVKQFGDSNGAFSGGRPEVNTTHAAGTAWGSGAITADAIAADAIGASELATDAVTEIVDAVWAAASRSLTVLDEDSTTLDLDATIRAALGMAAADLDTQIDTLALQSTALAIKASTDNLPSDPADESLIIAGINALQAHGDASWATVTAAAIRSAVGLASADLDTQLAAIKALADHLEGTVPARVLKNTALAAFPVSLVLSADGTPAAGIGDVTVERSIDGGAFAAIADPGSITEIGGGWYEFDFAAADLNGDTIAVKVTGTGVRQLDFTIVTQVAG